MPINRRALLGAAAASVVTPALAQMPAPESTLEERITEAARANCRPLRFDGARFSGEAYEMLLAEGRASRAFMLGEEHGVAENAKLAGQLFTALGYDKACVEISPPMAGELDRALAGGVDGMRRLFADPGANVAFFGLREEAEWLAAARESAGANFLWGLDYEVGGDRRLVAMLRAKRKPSSAQASLTALEDAQRASWAQYEETREPRYIFSFNGDPALVRALREAWPGADAEARWILDTLEETLTINQLWSQGSGWASNQHRAQFNRANLRRYFAAERRSPRVFYKFGSNHMLRGLTETFVHDIGSQIAERAEAEGGKSFRLLVLPGANSQAAALDPSAWRYNPNPVNTDDYRITPLMAAALPEGFSLIDLRPLRAVASGRRGGSLPFTLLGAIHGFDALAILTGATASANLL